VWRTASTLNLSGILRLNSTIIWFLVFIVRAVFLYDKQFCVGYFQLMFLPREWLCWVFVQIRYFLCRFKTWFCFSQLPAACLLAYTVYLSRHQAQGVVKLQARVSANRALALSVSVWMWITESTYSVRVTTLFFCRNGAAIVRTSTLAATSSSLICRGPRSIILRKEKKTTRWWKS